MPTAPFASFCRTAALLLLLLALQAVLGLAAQASAEPGAAADGLRLHGQLPADAGTQPAPTGEEDDSATASPADEEPGSACSRPDLSHPAVPTALLPPPTPGRRGQIAPGAIHVPPEPAALSA